MIQGHEFCTRWHEYGQRPVVERRRYMAEELRRLDATGAPLLTTILQCPYPSAQIVALEILRTGQSPDGDRVFASLPRHRLRLREGAVPPDRDPQGRPVPAEVRGKVLLAKVGNVGAAPQELAATDPSIARASKGPERRRREVTGRDLYLLCEVGREERDYPVDQALAVLRQWGHGVTLEKDKAIVEELPQRETKTTGKRAA